MRSFLLGNLLLAIAWMFVSGNFSAMNLAFGFVLGYFVLFVARRVIGAEGYLRRSWTLVKLLGFLVYDVLVSNLQLARDIVTPGLRTRPAVIAIPLEELTDMELVLLGTMLTLTPGDAVLEVSDDRRTMYVHAMYVDDVEGYRRRAKEQFERRLLEVMR